MHSSLLKGVILICLLIFISYHYCSYVNLYHTLLSLVVDIWSQIVTAALAPCGPGLLLTRMESYETKDL